MSRQFCSHEPFLRLTARSFLVIMLFAGYPPALAQAPQVGKVVQYDIPAQPLETAVQQVADKASLQLLYSPADLRGVTTRGLKGAYTPKDAIDRLIEGTGLIASFNGQNAIAIKPKPANDRGGQAANPTLLAQAQSAERREVPENAVQLEGIVVTAQKREERLLDVPSSISVVTGEEIERRGLTGADYLRGVPGASQMEGYQGQSIVIRGLETSPRAQNFSSGTTVATYFGETPTTNTAGLSGGTNIELKLVDIERIEVLRGPQGTAFGNSSLGGAVRTIPVAPKLDRFEGKAAAGYSATADTGGDNYEAHVVGNFPVIKDKLALRAVAYKYQDSGFYRNVAASDTAFQTAVASRYGAQAFAVNEENVGSYYASGGRIAALLQATNDLRFSLSFLSQKTETDGIPQANTGTYDQTLLQVAPEHADRGRRGGFFESDITIANAMVEYNFGWATLVATYSRTESDWIQSLPFGATGTQWALSYKGPGPHKEDVGEIRLATQLQGPWNFLAGLYGEKLKDQVEYNYIWFGDPATSPLARTCAALGALCQQGRLAAIYSDRRTLTQKAAFGEASWEFLPAFTLTGGVRAYDYDRTFRVDADGAFYGPAGLHAAADATATGQTYRANLSYKPSSNALVYAGWAQGFRLGRAQAGLPAGSCDPNGDGLVDGTSTSIDTTRRVNADNVDNYEIGAKFELLDHRLAITADAFRMEWSDVPVNVLARSLGSPPTSCAPLSYVANAGAARSEGVEFQANFQVDKAFRVDFGASWIHARLTEGVAALNVPSGNRLPGSPKVNANLGLQYEFQLGGYRGFARADSIYVGPFFGNLQQSPNTKAGGYVRLDASARMVFRNFNVDLFVRNLTNEDDFTFRGDAATTGESYGYRLRPRTIGFRVGYAF